MYMKRKTFSAYLYILPSLVFFVVFILYPIVFIFQTSFYEWDGFSVNKEFIGIGNYIDIFNSGYLPVVLKNFVIFGALTLIIQAFLGMVYAEFLRKRILFATFFKSLFFLPVVLTPVVVGYIFRSILEVNYGFLNTALRSLGLDIFTQEWLSNPKIALYTVSAVNIWQWTGFNMLLYIAGMTSIPDSIHDAASIDGASGIVKFIRITIPLLKHTHFTLSILGIIGALKVFDIIWVLTGGGPGVVTASFSTLILKESFVAYNQGASSALSVIMIIIAFIITAFQLKLYKKANY